MSIPHDTALSGADATLEERQKRNGHFENAAAESDEDRALASGCESSCVGADSPALSSLRKPSDSIAAAPDGPLQHILSLLEGVKKVGAGFKACCPAHEDRIPSLSITEGADGRVLLNCFANCSYSQICRRLGIHECDLFPAGRTARPPTQSKRRDTYPSIREATAGASTVWEYQDSGAKTVLWVARFERPKGKTFLPFHPVEGGVACGDPPGKLPLFGLSGLQQAELVFVVEGEKCVEAARSIGLVATCSAHGANAAAKTDWSPLARTNVIVIPDNDAAGRKYADDVAGSLTKLPDSATVRVLELPGLKEAGDIADWIEERDSRECEGLKRQIVSLAGDVEPFVPPNREYTVEKPETEQTKKSQATLLVELALAKGIELWHDENDVPHASLTVGSHREHYVVRGAPLKLWLLKLFYDETDRAPSSQAMQDAIGVLSGKARFDGMEHRVYVRIAGIDGTIYLDLADSEWRVVKIDSAGWEVVTNPSVNFRRTRGQLALPMPARGGCINDLRPFVNYGGEEQFVLLVAWLLGAFMPDGPYPILEVDGEQGCAKTTACRVLRQLVDPNQADLRSIPRSEHDLVIAARNGHVLGFDNLSGCPSWLSDALCRLATGAGFSARELYSDSEECLFSGARPILVNGIGGVASQADLLDRTIRVTLPTIEPDRRRDERGFWAEFRDARSAILGALLDAVVVGLGRLQGVELSAAPRMADFARWVVACEPALPWEEGAFLLAYTGNREQADRDAIEASPIGPAILQLLDGTSGEWIGTATQLLLELTDRVEGKPPKTWPVDGTRTSKALRRIAPPLRACGYTVLFGDASDRRIRLGRPGTNVLAD